MATQTWIPLATTTLSAATTQVTFSSIPTDGTYRDLVLVFSGAVDDGAGGITVFAMQLNGSTSGYQHTYMFGNGSTYSYANQTSRGQIDFDGGWFPAGEQQVVIAQIMDYASNVKNKQTIVRTDNASKASFILASNYSNNAVISSIKLFATRILTGSTISLYGV